MDDKFCEFFYIFINILEIFEYYKYFEYHEITRNFIRICQKLQELMRYYKNFNIFEKNIYNYIYISNFVKTC